MRTLHPCAEKKHARARQKKTRPAGAGRVDGAKVIPNSREGFGNLRLELNGSGVVPFHAMELVASLQHSVEFIDEHGDCLVTFVGLDRGIHIGALDLDMALSRELHADRGSAIARQFHAYPHDTLLMAKQTLGLLLNVRLERRGQFEVDARDDYFVVILAVHVSPCCFG
jgi:hypothetical protein